MEDGSLNNFNNGYRVYTEKYGSSPYQEGDLYLPDGKAIAVICLLHGGFWRMPYDRQQLTPLSMDLVKRGFIVWNIEYRRTGGEGGGWPGTFDDAVVSLNHLMFLKQKYESIDLSRIIVAGHSAGGHLAIWAAGQGDKNATGADALQIQPYAVIGLAPVLNLQRSISTREGREAVSALLGGSPDEYPQRYAVCSPIEMLPLKTRQLIIHGDCDEALPVEWTREYVDAARSAGDDITYIEIQHGQHMDYLDINSEAISRLRDCLLKV